MLKIVLWDAFFLGNYGLPVLWNMVVIFPLNHGIVWTFVLHDIIVGYRRFPRAIVGCQPCGV